MKDLEKYPVIQKFPVQWGDMDAAQHVNNLVYLRWAESARIYYFMKMNMDTSFSGDAAGPILGWQDCKYIFPITFPDTAVVGTRVIEILEDRFTLESAVFSEKHQRIASLSKHTIIAYDYKALKKAALPAAWLKGIKELENPTAV